MKQFTQRLPSFWTVQIIGWLVYMVAVYITFLTVSRPENYLSLFYIKAFRAFTGFCLTCILRQIYLRFPEKFSIRLIALLVMGCAAVFGYAWTLIEFWYFSLTGTNFDWTLNLIRSPKLALDYAMTLTAWSALYLGVKNWWSWQQERENALQSLALANKAQLDMLRYQLNPHFLFNALNSIRASIDEDAVRAKQMITQLSEFLRYSLLAESKKKISLSEELEAVRNYLAIEQIRFEDKLVVEFDIEQEAEDFQIPNFLLNPLVENAVKHGLQTSPKPLEIKISAKIVNKGLVLEVINSGMLNNGSDCNGNGIGLKNVRDRLQTLFGDNAAFELNQDGPFVKARIEISDETQSDHR